MLSAFLITNLRKLLISNDYKFVFDLFSREKKMLSRIREEFVISFFSEFVRLEISIFWYLLFQTEFVISNSEIRYNDFFKSQILKFVITNQNRYNLFRNLLII